MSWLTGQTWILMPASFLLGSLVTWILTPRKRKVVDVEVEANTIWL
jgi:hypothetical protein